MKAELIHILKVQACLWSPFLLTALLIGAYILSEAVWP